MVGIFPFNLMIMMEMMKVTKYIQVVLYYLGGVGVGVGGRGAPMALLAKDY